MPGVSPGTLRTREGGPLANLPILIPICLHLKVIAEGVEDEAQMSFLRHTSVMKFKLLFQQAFSG